jgi:hypothetical protein
MGTVDPVSRRVSPFDCATWAREVIDYLSTKFTKDERSVKLQPVVELATHMLSHLLIASMSLSHLLLCSRSFITAARNPGGKKTSQDSTHPSPNINRLRQIVTLLEEATTKRSQRALKDLVCNFYLWQYAWLDMYYQIHWRDGLICPFTGLRFAPPGRPVVPRCAHIIPFSFHDKVCGFALRGGSASAHYHSIASHAQGTRILYWAQGCRRSETKYQSSLQRVQCRIKRPRLV